MPWTASISIQRVPQLETAPYHSHLKQHHAVSIISAGGSEGFHRNCSVGSYRAQGITYTNFWSGYGMGHAMAVKAIDGVSSLGMTIPLGTGNSSNHGLY